MGLKLIDKYARDFINARALCEIQPMVEAVSYTHLIPALAYRLPE